MPLYEYICDHCGTRFEKLLNIAQRENVACECCGTKARRIYQGAGAFIPHSETSGDCTHAPSCACEDCPCGKAGRA